MTLRKAFLLVVTKLSRYDVDQNVTNDVNRDLTSDVTCDMMSDLWKDVDGVMELFQVKELYTIFHKSVFFNHFIIYVQFYKNYSRNVNVSDLMKLFTD